MERSYLTIKTLIVIVIIAAFAKAKATTTDAPFNQTLVTGANSIIPAQTTTVISTINIGQSYNGIQGKAVVKVEGALQVNSFSFSNVTGSENYNGVLTKQGNYSLVTFANIPALNSTQQYKITLTIAGNVMDAAGNPLPNNYASTITSIIYNPADSINQRNVAVKSIAVQTHTTTNLLFNYPQNTGLEADSIDAWSANVIDYNNDGREDLFITDKRANYPNRLYRGNGNGTFTRITTGDIVTDRAQSVTSAWADFDNDGDQDVVVANNTQKANFFYINNGNGTFTKNTTAGFTQSVGYYHHVSWVDIDNDGRLELFLGNYWPTRFNELWKRNSDNVWELQTNNILSQTQGSGVGATWADYDNDGYMDLLLPNNDGGNNKMFRNTGNSNFEAVDNSITQHGGHATGTTWGDIDNDGDLDLFIANAGNQNNELYRNDGNGNFTLITEVPVVSDAGHSHGCTFTDVDKDMDLDLLVMNDQGVKFLYLNNGTGSFTRKADEWPTANIGNTYAIQTGDFDNDGDIDLVQSTHGGKRSYIFTGKNNSRRWLRVRLAGTNSNRGAVGARVRVKAGEKWQTRFVSTQNGFAGQSSARLLFGMDSFIRADSIEIKWPSGLLQKFKGVLTNQGVLITEPSTGRISATAYLDANANCSKQNSEAVLSNVHFKIMPGNYHAYTNNIGVFSISLPVGNYTATVVDNNLSLSCGSLQIQINHCGQQSSLGNVALRAGCTGPNLKVTASAPAMRRGFDNHYLFTITNNGIGNAQNVIAKAVLPSSLTVLGSNIAWTSNTTSGQLTTLTWNLAQLPAGKDTTIQVDFNITLSLMPDDIIASVFTATVGTDCSVDDNNYTDYQRIFGSIDPNDILAFPVGDTENHYISNTQEITYRIRFQNVGNYPAEFVTIIDTLPTSLDIAKIHRISSSHNMEMSINGHIITFFFDNIQLPDSTSDEPGSHGYVQFSIPQVEGNAVGTTITNRAAIIFDYNEAIITNTVFHNVLIYGNANNGKSLLVFPNPTEGESYILSPKTGHGVAEEIISYKVVDNSGATVYSTLCNGVAPIINIAHLPNGLYTIQAYTANSMYSGKVVLQH